jgi:nitrogen fixation/metabolism regulation signal transduction histidine kinase
LNKAHRYQILCLLFAVIANCIACVLFTKGHTALAAFAAAAAIVLIVYIFRVISSIFRDFEYFVEAVRFRDFSKRYPVQKAWKGRLYSHFNEITEAFTSLNMEKDAHRQYLETILELVNTGILAYDIETGNILWMNESFRNLFKLPYFRNIQQMELRNTKLYMELMEIAPSEGKLITITEKTGTIKALSNSSVFRTAGKTYKLVSFHNISATLEEVEAGAWKGLLDVMTHEIMNSIAPVASLADTLKKRMEILKHSLNTEVHLDFEDMELAMETIRRRSEGLLRFADMYRTLSKTIVPSMKLDNLNEVLDAVYRLMLPSMQQKGIFLEAKPDSVPVQALIDRTLIEQALINFITNAAYAVRDSKSPHIVLITGFTHENNPRITVVDNGCGIPDEVRDKIFIPFFSTRKNGSGIGLSLVREIVKLHKGSLLVHSEEGQGSAFTMSLNRT